MYVGGVPVFPATEKQKAPIIKLVQTILADPDSPSVPQLEAEINHLVYCLYNLTPDEIKLIENSKGLEKIG
jgi:hypothetical protein